MSIVDNWEVCIVFWIRQKQTGKYIVVVVNARQFIIKKFFNQNNK